MMDDGGPGHVRLRTGYIPYSEVLLRAQHYVPYDNVLGSQALNGVTGTIWWHRHYIPFPISLDGYCFVVDTTTIVSQGANNAAMKMALYYSHATTKYPTTLVTGTDVPWSNNDLIPPTSGDNVAHTGRIVRLPQEVQILVPGVYHVGIRTNQIATGNAKAQRVLDPSLLKSTVGSDLRMYDLKTVDKDYTSGWPPNPTVDDADNTTANVIVGLLCNRLIP